MFTKEKSQYIEDSKFRYTVREMKKNASVYLLLAPYFILFTIFTIVPVLLSLPMGFTNFNMVQFPQFVGLNNFYALILEDEVFLTAIQNTLVFAIITGPLSYILCFVLAWLINEMPRALKTVFTFIFYAPTLAGNIYTTWQLIFSGDTYGIANSYLLDLGIINRARQWLTDANYIMGVVIIVQLWISLGAGFLVFFGNQYFCFCAHNLPHFSNISRKKILPNIGRQINALCDEILPKFKWKNLEIILTM